MAEQCNGSNDCSFDVIVEKCNCECHKSIICWQLQTQQLPQLVRCVRLGVRKS